MTSAVCQSLAYVKIISLTARQFEQVLWTGWMAALILNADRWNAGAALMETQSAEAWRVLMDTGNLSTVNSEARGACRNAAAKAKKEQRCTVVVPAP
jgi:3-phosphoglycerate kinase